MSNYQYGIFTKAVAWFLCGSFILFVAMSGIARLHHNHVVSSSRSNLTHTIRQNHFWAVMAGREQPTKIASDRLAVDVRQFVTNPPKQTGSGPVLMPSSLDQVYVPEDRYKGVNDYLGTYVFKGVTDTNNDGGLFDSDFAKDVDRLQSDGLASLQRPLPRLKTGPPTGMAAWLTWTHLFYFWLVMGIVAYLLASLLGFERTRFSDRVEYDFFHRFPTEWYAHWVEPWDRNRMIVLSPVIMLGIWVLPTAAKWFHKVRSWLTARELFKRSPFRDEIKRVQRHRLVLLEAQKDAPNDREIADAIANADLTIEELRSGLPSELAAASRAAVVARTAAEIRQIRENARAGTDVANTSLK